MEIYVAIWEDRHTDTDAIVFSTAEAAIAWAKKTCREFDRFDDLEETEGNDLTAEMQRDGWIYVGEYSCEGDGIRVVRRVVDEKNP